MRNIKLTEVKYVNLQLYLSYFEGFNSGLNEGISSFSFLRRIDSLTLFILKIKRKVIKYELIREKRNNIQIFLIA